MRVRRAGGRKIGVGEICQQNYDVLLKETKILRFVRKKEKKLLKIKQFEAVFLILLFK